MIHIEVENSTLLLRVTALLRLNRLARNLDRQDRYQKVPSEYMETMSLLLRGVPYISAQNSHLPFYRAHTGASTNNSPKA